MFPAFLWRMTTPFLNSYIPLGKSNIDITDIEFSNIDIRYQHS
jgi:hypothetical protein